MPSSQAHTIVGGLSGLAVAVLDKSSYGDGQHDPIIYIGIGAVFGKLPDILESSLKNPNHRQFFHSILMVALVWCVAKKVSEWEPQNMNESIARFILICAGTGYLSHSCY